MKVLVLGGTQFIGPHIVDVLLARGHEVTLFNRGQTAAPRAHTENLVGDRLQSELSVLDGRTFDATIDMCAYVPRVVHEVLDVLGDPGHYVLVSSVSVYDSFELPGLREDSPTHLLADPNTEEVTGETYGGLKVLCEKAVGARCDRFTVLRPGLVIGPKDTTDRFTYWVANGLAEPVVIAPGRPSDPTQWIDARDFAQFAELVISSALTGCFNVVTDPGRHTIGELLFCCGQVAETDFATLWLGADELEGLELSPWVDLPAWAPPTGPTAGLALVDNRRARDAGLTTRPLLDTVRDTAAWWTDQERTLKAGMSAERHRGLLASLASYVQIRSARDDDRSTVESLVGDEAMHGEPYLLEFVATVDAEVVGYLRCTADVTAQWNMQLFTAATATDEVESLLTSFAQQAAGQHGAAVKGTAR